MAYSKAEDFKRWIKKLKYRQIVFEKIGDTRGADKVKRKRELAVKQHEL